MTLELITEVHITYSKYKSNLFKGEQTVKKIEIRKQKKKIKLLKEQLNKFQKIY